MRARANPEISRAVNQQAHTLAAQSFASIRAAIQDKARELLRDGKTVDDVTTTWKTPAKYVGYATPQAARVQGGAEVIWGETR